MIYLLRHGQSETNLTRVFAGRTLDPALTAKGIQQAEEMGEALASVEFGAIYTSTLQRAYETASIISRGRAADPIVIDDLCEVDLGILDRQPIDDPAAQARLDRLLERWERGQREASIPAGESLDDVKKRLDKVLSRVHQSDTSKPILVVGHGLLFMCWVWCYCTNRPTTLLDAYMSNARLALVSHADEQQRLEHFNLEPVDITEVILSS